MATRIRIALPAQLVESIDALAGKSGRGAFITETVERELRRRRLLAALDAAAGSWKDEDHPELRHGAARWVRQMRSGKDVARSKR